MQNRELIRKAKEYYKNIGYIECPAFNNKKVYFNNYGFNHLIYKGKDKRTKNEIANRLSLLPKVPIILNTITSIYKSKISIKGESIARFWELRKTDQKNNVICIIIRKLNDSNLHFFSVFSK